MLIFKFIDLIQWIPAQQENGRTYDDDNEDLLTKSNSMKGISKSGLMS